MIGLSKRGQSRERLVELTAERGLANAVNFPFGAAPSVDFIQAQLADGALGEIVGVDLRLHFVPWPRVWQQDATWLSDQGESLKLAQAQLGHSDIATTLQVYTHAVPASQRDAVDRLESILFPSVPKNEEGGVVEETENPLPTAT